MGLKARPASAIITGGGTGIGRGIVEEFVNGGADCVIVGRRHEPLDATATDLAGAPGDVLAVQADVTEPEDRARLVDACIEAYGSVDVLVNNAGITATAPLLDYDVASWRAVMTTHTVNGVTPGMVPVDAIPMADEIRERLTAMTPLGRVGEPSDIAPAVFFLASPAASFITGGGLEDRWRLVDLVALGGAASALARWSRGRPGRTSDGG